MENTYIFPPSVEDPETIIPQNRASIYENYFNNLKVALKIYNSSPRITDNQFHSNVNIGLNDQSFPDLSWNSKNSFQGKYHIYFVGSISSSIQLSNGHNDFYNPSSTDFYSNNLSLNMPVKINCNKNWWGERIDGVYIKASQNVLNSLEFDVNLLDPSPNYMIHSIETILDQAKDYEMKGMYDEALAIYKTILVNRIEDEQDMWKECVDQCFNMTEWLKGDYSELAGFYQNLLDNPPSYLSNDALSEYQSLMNDYIKRCDMLVQTKSGPRYLVAKSILQNRINNSDSEEDVLLAGINLDNILLLEEYENCDAKSAINFEERKTRIDKLILSKEDKYARLEQLQNEQDNNAQTIPKKLFSQNYPNPFNPSTTIQYGLAKDTHVKINIYNIKGQKVKTLINENKQAGVHKIIWDGKDHKQKNVSSGIYFYHIQTNHGTVTRKMLMMK